MPDRSSAEMALNPLAVTPVEDLRDRLFWNEVSARSREAVGEKAGHEGFGDGFGQM